MNRRSLLPIRRPRPLARWAGALPFLLLLSIARNDAGAFETRLGTLREAVAERAAEMGVGDPPRTREKRVLAAALRRLDRPREDLPADLKAAAKVFGLLDRHFPGDAAFGDPLEVAATMLHDDVMEERAALAAWTGKTGSDRAEARLGRGIEDLDRRLGTAEAEADRPRHALLLHHALKVARRTRKALRMDAPRSGPPPFQGTAPDFQIEDVNPASPTAGEDVSPRDYAGMVTAWAFLRST